MQIIGTSEVSEIFKVSKSVVCHWINRNEDFPEPIAHLAMGKIWNKRDILKWGRKHGKFS